MARAAAPPVETWYAAQLIERPTYSSLLRATEADVCIIGGGFAGLWTAHALAARGRSVVLLEAGRLGDGASGRNGGFVSAGFALGTEDLVAKVGLDTAKALFSLSITGLDAVAAIADRHAGIRMGSGWLVVSRTPNRDDMARSRDMMAEKFNYPAELLDTDAVRALLATPRYFCGLRSPGAFHVQPLQLIVVLAREATAAGARLFEHSAALGLDVVRGGMRVRAGSGTVTARHVVQCTSAAKPGLTPVIERAVLPVATYVAVTEPLGDKLTTAVRTREAIADTRRAGDYYRIVNGDRLLWGGRITTARRPPRALAETLRGDMLSIYPQLSAGRIPRMETAWPGEMAYALHKMPIITQSRPGQWVATAFGGHGLNTTAMAGLLIARAITGEDDQYRRFELLGAPWAGGRLGRVGVQASYWAMQARDRWDEARSRL